MLVDQMLDYEHDDFSKINLVILFLCNKEMEFPDTRFLVQFQGTLHRVVVLSQLPFYNLWLLLLHISVGIPISLSHNLPPPIWFSVWQCHGSMGSSLWLDYFPLSKSNGIADPAKSYSLQHIFSKIILPSGMQNALSFILIREFLPGFTKWVPLGMTP